MMTMNAGIRFAGWKQDPEPVRQSLERLEDALEQPVNMKEAAERAVSAYPVEFRAEIQAVKDMLEKVTDNNGYGMAAAIQTLNLTEKTGYQLTSDESKKLQMLIKKVTSDYDLTSAIEHFPTRSELSSQEYTEQELVRYIQAWAKEQVDHRPLAKLIAAIDRSERFQAPAAVNEALSERLEAIKQDLSSPEVRQTYLANLGTYFRPKAAMVADVKKVVDALLPDADLFSPDRDTAVAQAVDLAARRSAKIEYAGRAGDGKLYLVTKGLDGRDTTIYYGEPGQLKALTVSGSMGAMDGSATWLNTEEGIKFYFKRGGLFDRNDKSLWCAIVNDVPVAQEYPTDELDAGR